MKFFHALYVARSLALFLTLSLLAAPAAAHPVTFKDGFEPWFRVTPNLADLQANYSFRADSSVGLRYLDFDNDNVDRQITLLQGNYLLNRWNLEKAQANIYLTAGVGSATGNFENHETTVLGGFAADYETRRFHTELDVTTLHSDEFTHIASELHLGIAPYIADFDELHTWVMVKFGYVSEFDDHVQVTPFLRFFQDEFLWEIGANLDGEPMINFMVHF